eukprot:43261_1
MVREIVAIQVGQCGNQIGNVFWETMCKEHSVDVGTGKFKPAEKESEDKKESEANGIDVDAMRLEKINVYFEETSSRRYVPRSILVDLEPGVLDALKARAIGTLFKPDNFIFGQNGAGNNWAKSHYVEGPELIDEICDRIRRCMEGADCPQGLSLTQSLGGGTGSGLGSLLLLKLREHYPDRILNTFSVFPSEKVSDVVVEPYNATLTIPMLIQDCDQVNVIDNEALVSVSHNVLKQKDPKFSDLNWVISLVMSGVTASLRFPGRLNGDLRKMGVNLVPFPRLHFFTVAAAPLFSQRAAAREASHVNLTVREILDQLWSGNNFLSKINMDDGRYLSTSIVYRGEALKTYEVEDEQRQLQDKLMDDFVNWIPNNIMTSVVNVSSQHSNIDGSFVANFTGINAVFRRISKQFRKMYKKKAFLHWYIGVGMDQFEIEEAHKNVEDLCKELQDKSDTIVDEDNPFNRDINDDAEIIGDSTDDENDNKNKYGDRSDSDGIILGDDSDSGGLIQDDSD